MTSILRIESRKRVRESLTLTGAFALIAVFFFAVFPAMQEEAQLIEEAFPEYLVGLIGFEDMHLIEGFTGSYIYSLLWVVFVGIYFAYLSAGLIVGDIRSRRMDLTLSNPVSRESVILQKFASLWVPLLVLNAGFLVVVLTGAALIGESLDLGAMVMVHLLSLPYLLVCAGIGLVFSVVLDREGNAQVSALGMVFLLWLVEGLSHSQEDFEWVGAFTPHRYFDPAAILVDEEYAFLDAGLLLVVFLILLSVAVVSFVRRDI